MSRTVLLTGATRATGRISSHDVRTVVGHKPITPVEAAVASAGARPR